MKKNQQPKKMDLYEYEEKYVNKQNYKNVKTFIYLVLTALGILVAVTLVDFSYKSYQLNQYLGYGVIAISVLVFIFFYLVPCCKLMNVKSFEIDVSRHNVKKAIKHNKSLRKELAEKFVDFNKNVENGSWYSSEKMDAIEYALLSKDDELIKTALTDVYQTDVKKQGSKLVFNTAKDVAIGTALSQNATLDTLVVATANLKMIKDIVFLYGFRPTYPRLLKIYGKVMTNSLLAMGVANFNAGTSIANAVGGFFKGIPLLGEVVATAIDCSVQGMANGVATTIIGFQTIEYLKKEYNLQNVLDKVDLGNYDESVKNITSKLLESLNDKQQKSKQDKVA